MSLSSAPPPEGTYAVLIVGHRGCQVHPERVSVQRWLESDNLHQAEKALARFRAGILILTCPRCGRRMPPKRRLARAEPR